MLEVKKLNKYFKSFHAVKDLSFVVNKGDIYGFLGPNGAGKSTTLRMILGLIYPDSGGVIFNGKKISKYDRSYLKDIGALIERPDFYENLSAWNNLKIFARLAKLKDSEKRIQEVLEEVKLYDRRDSRVKSYSQGMKQRLGLAQALLHKPSLIILDEPSNGLDPQGQADMRELIRRINHEMQITVIISSHILTEIEQIANRMIIINHGEKISEGGVHDLMGTDEMKYELRASDSTMLVKRLAERSISTEVSDARVRIRIAEKEIPELTKWLLNSGVELYECKQLRTLEEYFLNLIK